MRYPLSAYTAGVLTISLLWYALSTISRTPPIREWEAHHDRVNGLAFAPKDNVLVTAGGREDTRVACWDMASGRLLREYNLGSEAMTLALSPRGHLAAISTADQRVLLWNFETGRLDGTIREESLAGGLCFSPDGRYVAGGLRYIALWIWEVSTGRLAHTVKGLGYPLAYSADGRYLVAYRAEPDTAEILDSQTLERVGLVRPRYPFISALAISDDSALLATADTNGKIWLWRIPGGEPLGSLSLRKPAYSVAFAHERDRLVAGTAGRFEVWDYRRGRRIAVTSVISNHPPEVDVSRTGVIATGGDKGVVQLWKLP